MDPSKRICLKNLPEGCTKRELAELVRNRTGTPIHSIDLGLDADGKTRRYAHFSCEGAKHVLEVLSTGVSLRDSTIYAHPAKTHYSFRYAEARRKRERAEAEEKEQLEAFWAASRQRFLDRTNGGELPKNKIPKDFYASKRKYARIAAEIAQMSRNAHAAARGGAAYAEHPRGAAHAAPPFSGADCGTNSAYRAASKDHGTSGGGAAAACEPPRTTAGGGDANAAKKCASRLTAAKSQAPAVAPPPPPPPGPTKEERKLSGLQAKLAALKEKLKK
ncbi:conserved hypothetical protein [Leishmania mexicana MHOM/GT/2001/U1103]|uniref:RRM domain-containing protein n=1 Tax=Leishmania mexicana (strain MHOM/GT/2001/U1103) TaxID=929439 RepID=E9AT25_LEIMU|nr:conserved hypothetical protein [Leishmania mexicana MHOM/GT/2001/U1103]CBZ26099.1 conserved hypothetical protein [Leishmania mexicana MHOM/GT/2001/U1103]